MLFLYWLVLSKCAGFGDPVLQDWYLMHPLSFSSSPLQAIPFHTSSTQVPTTHNDAWGSDDKWKEDIARQVGVFFALIWCQRTLLSAHLTNYVSSSRTDPRSVSGTSISSQLYMRSRSCVKIDLNVSFPRSPSHMCKQLIFFA